MVILVVVIVLAYVLSGGFHHTSGPSAQVILPRGTSYALQGGGSASITLTITTPSVLAGTFQTGGIAVYTMTPTQYGTLVKSGNVTGYEWTSGSIPDQSFYNLSVSFPAGSWVLALVDPSPTTPTAVIFYTDVTLTPT